MSRPVRQVLWMTIEEARLLCRRLFGDCVWWLAGCGWCVVLVWARAAAREHLDWRGPGCQAVRLHGVRHVLVGWRGGVGAERVGERGALHDPMDSMILNIGFCNTIKMI
eukprot:scaffold25416_cov30-Tisochrysis_lutea.AAC.3